MRSRWFCAGVLTVCLASPVAGAQEAPDGGITAARSAVGEFGAALKAALSTALASGDPVAALDVCSGEAPHIAGVVTDRSGITVGRVSERLRNPANQPGDRQLAVLREWQADLARGIDISKRESYDEQPDGGFTYMRPIFIQPLCLVCHGESLSIELRAALATRYPADRATGYRVGDLRGAFVAHQ